MFNRKRRALGRIVFGARPPYPRSIVKLPDVYKDWRIMAGLMLVFLGAGNWMIGLNKARAAMPDDRAGREHLAQQRLSQLR